MQGIIYIVSIKNMLLDENVYVLNLFLMKVVGEIINTYIRYACILISTNATLRPEMVYLLIHAYLLSHQSFGTSKL